MIYQAYSPRFPLDQFIEVFVYYEGVDLGHKVDRFLPNGDTEIVIDFHDTPQFIYDNETLKEIQACNHVWASGLRTEPITIPSGNGSAMMVISFKKGKASPFFPLPMDEIADCVVDADLLWADDFALLRERLLETAETDRRFRLTEEFLLEKVGDKLEPNPCVAYAVREMIHRPDQTNMARMNNRIGYSQKHFIEMFRNEVGVAPKSFLQIMRFQKAIRTIDATKSINWSAIAHECGFYPFFLGNPATTWRWGVAAGLLAGVGWAATQFFIIALFEQRTWKHIAINCGYITLYFAVIGFVLGIWR